MTLFNQITDNLDYYIKLTHLSSMKFHGARFSDHLVEQTLLDYADFMDDVAPISDNRLTPPEFPGSLIHKVTRPTIMTAQDDLDYRTALDNYNIER